MGEPLTRLLGAPEVRRIADMVAAVHPAFPAGAFRADALDGLDGLALTPRGRHVAHALRRRLPDDFEQAAAVLVASLGPPADGDDVPGEGSFLYLPHAFLVAAYGLDHFEASMRACHAITRRFTAEFTVRPFIERHPRATLARLAEWTADPSPHVRRLVSEGTRPRLPWAPRLRAFQRDPAPVLALLEALRDDPARYVQRSVANNLNDIGKDHPGVLVDTCARWARDAPPGRAWVVRHALRHAVKRGDPGALAVLGYEHGAPALVEGAGVDLPVAPIGGGVTVRATVANPGPGPMRLVVDLRVHYVTARGGTSPRVFKVRALELAPGDRVRVAKRLSLAQRTTRTHRPGAHRVELLVNGRAVPAGVFEVIPAESPTTA